MPSVAAVLEELARRGVEAIGLKVGSDVAFATRAVSRSIARTMS
jgi:uridine phosphorylase